MADEVTVEQAIEFLTPYVPDAEALKGMEAETVLSHYNRVNESNTKLIEDGVKAAQEGIVPEKYELTLPEESKLNEAVLESVAKVAKEGKLSNEQAALLVNQREAGFQEAQKAAQETWESIRTEWAETAKKDAEIGGDNWAETERLAQLPIEKFMSDDMREFMKDTGYNNHPEVIRFLRKIGEAMAEDDPKLLGGGNAPGQGGKGGEKSAADVLYDNTPAS